MATITIGTGGTINATTIEGQLWQLIHFIQNAERSSTDTEKFTSSKDDTFIMTGTFSIPAIFTRDVNGIFLDTAAIYNPGGVLFNPGSPLGTIKGLTLAQYFIDTISYICVWQNNLLKNPQAQKNVTLKLDVNALEYAGTFNIPYTNILSAAGAVSETATEWLTT